MKVNKNGTVTISETDLHALSGLVMRENGEAYKEEDLPVVAEFMQDLVILMFRMGGDDGNRDRKHNPCR